MKEEVALSVPAHELQLSVDEYLKFESGSECKHEFVEDRVFAMGGASQAHDALVINLTLLLGPSVKAAGCRIFSSDMKVRVESTSSFYYPDLTLSFESFLPKSSYITAPSLIVEVLSPSTGDIDRRERLLAYKTIDSLNEYVIVYQDQRRVEIYKRVLRDWEVSVSAGDEGFTLSPANNMYFNISMKDLYEGVIS